MRVLFIASGYLPYTFSENLCNAKLVYALQQDGWQVDVISKRDEGATYSAEWTAPWLPLQKHAFEVSYAGGSSLARAVDIVRSSFATGMLPVEGIRWVRRTVAKVVELQSRNHYDCLLTRSPNDIAHYVGFIVKKKTGLKWIANWNDPASPIWPGLYAHHYSAFKQKLLMHYTRQCLTTADVNTFPSEYLLRHFEAFFPELTNKSNRVIPHIALTEDIFPNISFPHNDRLMLCHSGNLSSERNPEKLFKAIRALIDEGCDRIRLDIMGRINDYTQALVQKYNLTDYVKCPGSFPYLEAIARMSAYDVLVLVEAILDKGIFFPSKLTDYAQLGKPILAISPSNGFAHDMLEKFGGGILSDNTSSSQIKVGLKELYQCWQNGSLAEKYSTQKMYEYFSANAVVKMYEEMLESGRN
ncbi:MAG: glycosyltransferase [Spirochaetia bacterium]|nr:glycosyltransferase [Spirochaetia bacterium]